MKRWNTAGKRIFSFFLMIAMLATMVPIMAQTASAASEQWLWPVATVKSINSLYGYRDYKQNDGTWKYNDEHEGIDIPAGMGTPVRATKSGTVYKAVAKYGDSQHENAAAEGNHIILNHGDGTYSIYMHLKNNIRVKQGDKVRQGDTIAYSGDSGRSTGAHLHFQLCTNPEYFNSTSLNPMPTNPEITYNKDKYRPVSGWPTAFITYIFTPDMTEMTEEILPSHIEIQITKNNTYVKTLPCSRDSNPESDDIEIANLGDVYEVTALHKNIYGNLWYQVINKTNGGRGFIYAPQASPQKQLLDDVAITDVAAPTDHIKGKSFPLKGYIDARYQTLWYVAATVWDMNGNMIAKSEANINTNIYNLKGSSVDNGLAFGKLDTGSYQYMVFAGARSYYAVNETEYEYVDDTIMVHGSYFYVHQYSSAITLPATCTTNGVKTFTCVDCGTQYKETIPATGHSYTSEVLSTASCDVDGVTRFTCSKCSDQYEERVPALGHTWGEPYQVREATCFEWGRYAQECTVCNATTSFETDPLVHDNYDSYVLTIVEAPTLTRPGTASLTCTICEITVDCEIPVLNDTDYIVEGNRYTLVTDFGDFTFEGVPEQEVASGACGDNLNWVLYEDGTLTISGTGEMFRYNMYEYPWNAYNDQIQYVVLGNGITSISDFAFRYCNMSDIVIPQGITYIGSGAFNNCVNLRSLFIPASVTFIASDALSFECTSLTEIRVDENNSVYSSDSQGVLFNKDQTVLHKVPCAIAGSYTIPDTVTELWFHAFAGCKNLTSIEVPESVTLLHEFCFQGCSSLTEIKLPDTIESIPYGTFNACSSLAHITLPANTRLIGNSAFLGCQLLESISIPATVESIGDNAFTDCGSLSRVEFLGDAPEIAEYAFSGVTTQVIVPDTWTSEQMQSYDGNLSWIVRGETVGLEISELPQRNSYLVGDQLDLTGLVVAAHYDNGTIETLPDNGYTVSAVDMSTPGRKTVTVSFGGINASYEILVHEGSRQELDPSLFPESAHNYAVNTDETQTVTLSGAGMLYLEFAPETCTDNNFDFIYIYDGSGNELGKYTDTQLAGQTIAIIGDTARIRLTSDSSQNKYGYSFTRIYGDVPIHVGTQTVPGVEPTCTETGLTNGVICDICGKEAFQVAPALGHDYVSVVTPPTEDALGYTTHTCTRCGDSYVDSYSYFGSIASGSCGEKLSWSLSEDGVLTIFGEGDMYDFDSDRPIPWGDWSQQITSVVFESGVTSIGSCAFAFHPITSVTIPDSVTRIGTAAFAYTINLTHVELPDGLLTIEDEAFAISALTEIYIPASVTNIGAQALVCPNMTAIHVDEYSANYYDSDGLLYTGNILLQVPTGYQGELTLNDYTHFIEEKAFLYCGSLTKVNVSASTNEICAGAFANCTALSEVCFRGDVPTIPENLFDGMTLTVSHPDANATWTQEAKQTFGGTITWTTYGENLVAEGYCGENHLFTDDYSALTSYKHCAPGENAVWTLTSDGTLTISGTGKTFDCIFFVGNIPWVWITDKDASRVNRVVVEEGITMIGAMNYIAFGSNSVDLILPSTLETLAPMSFNGCSSLKTLRFQSDAPSFTDGEFEGGTTTVYYPAGNATWTDSVKQRFGSTLTWVSLYEVQENENVVITPELDAQLEFHADGDLSKFEYVTMDGATVDSSNYTVTEGVNILFNAEYLKTLSIGVHTATVHFSDNSAVATITVVEKVETILGDVNSDGTVNGEDRLVLTRYLAKWTGYTEDMINFEAADVNCDGKVNAQDRLILTRHLAAWTGYEVLGSNFT